MITRNKISAKAGIQLRNNGFPRIKYGASSVKPGMTNKGKGLLTHYTIGNNPSNATDDHQEKPINTD